MGSNLQSLFKSRSAVALRVRKQLNGKFYKSLLVGGNMLSVLGVSKRSDYGSFRNRLTHGLSNV